MSTRTRIARAWRDTYSRDKWPLETFKALFVLVAATVLLSRWQSPRDALEYLEVGSISLATTVVFEALFLLWNFARVPLKEARESNARLVEENAQLKALSNALTAAAARPEPPRRYTPDEQLDLALQCLRMMADHRAKIGQPAPFFLSEFLKADPEMFGSPIVALDTFDWPRIRRRFTGTGVLTADEIERPFVSFGGRHFSHDFRFIVPTS